MSTLPVDHSKKLPDSICAACDVTRGYYMLLLFLFVMLLFIVFCFVLFCFVLLCFLFFRDSNMIYKGIAEFRYYVVIIILVNVKENLKL